MRTMHRGSIVVACLVTALVAAVGGPADATPGSATPASATLANAAAPPTSPRVDEPVPPSPADPSHPIDDPALLAETGPAAVRDNAPASRQTTVEVTHEADDDQVVQRIAALGGSSIVAVGDNLVQAEVPIRSLDALALSPGITYVRKAIANKVDPGRLDRTGDAAQPQVGSHSTSGVAITGANAWQSAGITGAGVKIGILDYFSPQWTSMQAAGDVPAPAGVRCLDSVGAGLCLGGTNTVFDASNSGHGNAVAETIHDMAPGATLYLATSASTADDQRIVDWFHANGVTIISTSLGWVYDGPGNGTGPEDAVVARAAGYGMAWVTAAGNQGSGAYWRGTWSDTDRDRYLEFAPGDEYLDISSDNGAGVCPPGTSLVWLAGGRWNDWGSPSTRSDLTFEIWSRVGSSYTLWTRDASNQNTGASPIELAGAETCVPGQPAIRVRYTGGPSPAGDVIELLSWYGTPQHAQSAFSASTPVADSPHAITVGAIDPAAGTSLASYSSRGPTNDGRMKPDLSAPSCFSSSVFTPCFNGTSAATPIVSGAAALVLQKRLVAGPRLLGAFLRHDVIDRGGAGPDNAFGTGELCLGAMPQPGATCVGQAPSGAVARTASRFTPTVPVRLMDSRKVALSPPGLAGRARTSSVVDVPVAGHSPGGVPADATAVVLNVTVVNPIASGYVQVVPTNRSAIGGSSNLNVVAGVTRANLVVVPIGQGGKVSIYSSSGGYYLLDVLGYFTAQAAAATSGRLVPVTPQRVLDTRATSAQHPEWLPAGWIDHKPAARETVTIALGAASGIPANDAAAVVLNVTATGPVTAGYVTVFAGDAPKPTASNINVTAGATVANLVVVPLGAGNTINLYASASTHLIADVAGYFTSSSVAASGAGRFVPLPASRLVDTRTSGGQFAAGTTRTYSVLSRAGVPASGVAAVLANLTAHAHRRRRLAHAVPRRSASPDGLEPELGHRRRDGRQRGVGPARQRGTDRRAHVGHHRRHHRRQRLLHQRLTLTRPCAEASRRAAASAALGHPGVDQLAGDRDPRRDHRQLVAAVPTGIGDLGRVALDLAAGVFGAEAEHERVRERPGLAALVPHIGDGDADLLRHFPHHRPLERLARLHEAGKAGVHRHVPLHAACQQRPVALRDQRDHRRGEARVGEQPARGAAHRPLARRRRGRRRAATAEAMGPGPLDELHGSAGDQPLLLGRPPEVGVEVDRRAVRRVDIHRHVDAPAGDAVERAQEVRRPVPLRRRIGLEHPRVHDVEPPGGGRVTGRGEGRDERHGASMAPRTTGRTISGLTISP